jgi:VanZ family protein
MASWWRKLNLLYYWLPPILWGLAVLVMSGDLGSHKNTLDLLKWLLSWFGAQTPAELDTINGYLREGGHAMAYGLMFFLWFRAFYAHGDFGPRRSLFYSLGMCLFLASVDEGHQWFVSSRSGSIGDVLQDMSGCILSALLTFAVWISRDYIASRPKRRFWRRPHLLSYWLPPLLWTLAMLVMASGVISVGSTLGALKWFVSWFALVDSYDLKILNVYLWKSGCFLAYGILYVLWFRAFQGYRGGNPTRALILSLGLCLVPSIIYASYQAFTAGQGKIIQEVLLGLSGSILAGLIIFAFMPPHLQGSVISAIARRKTNDLQ